MRFTVRQDGRVVAGPRGPDETTVFEGVVPEVGKRLRITAGARSTLHAYVEKEESSDSAWSMWQTNGAWEGFRVSLSADQTKVLFHGVGDGLGGGEGLRSAMVAHEFTKRYTYDRAAWDEFASRISEAVVVHAVHES